MHQHNLTLSMGTGVVQCQGHLINCLEERKLPTVYRIRAKHTKELPPTSETVNGSFDKNVPYFQNGLTEDHDEK